MFLGSTKLPPPLKTSCENMLKLALPGRACRDPHEKYISGKLNLKS